MILFIVKGLLFVAFLETAFPSYTVYEQKEDGTIVEYGVSRKHVESFMDESGMVDLEALQGNVGD